MCRGWTSSICAAGGAIAWTNSAGRDFVLAPTDRISICQTRGPADLPRTAVAFARCIHFVAALPVNRGWPANQSGAGQVTSPPP